MGDARLQVYFLEHGYQWLTGAVSTFWDAPFFYPATNVMAYSDTHLGSLPIYAFFRVLGVGRDSSFQVWMLVLFSLNYLSAVVALHLLRFSLPISAVAAYGFAFSLPLVTQVAHIQLLEVFCVPIILACLLRFLDSGDLRWLAVAAVGFVWQMYCSVYIGYFVLLVATAILAAKLILRLTSVPKSEWFVPVRSTRSRIISVTLGIFGVLLSIYPLYSHYGSGFAVAGGRSSDQVMLMIPRWQSFLLPYQHSYLWSGLNSLAEGVPHSWEHHLFPGLVLLGATIAAIALFRNIKRTDPTVACAILALVLVVPAILVWASWSPYELLLYLVPATTAFRAVSRIIFVYLFLMSVCLACVLSLLSARLANDRQRRMLLAGFGLALFADLSFPAAGLGYDKAVSQSRIDKIVSALPSDRANLVLVHIPSALDPAHQDEHHVDAMLAAQEAGVPTVNGLSGKYPPGYAFDLTQGFAAIRPWIRQNAALGADFSKLFVDGPRPSALNFGTSCTEVIADRRARIMATDFLALYAGDSISVPIQVTNKGISKWCAGPDSQGIRNVGVASRWLNPKGKEFVPYQHTIGIPRDLGPGEQASQRQWIVAPSEPGLYTLELRVLQQGLAFFDTTGGQITVRVLTAPAGIRLMTMQATQEFYGCSQPPQSSPLALRAKGPINAAGGEQIYLVEAANESKTWWCAPGDQSILETVSLLSRPVAAGNLASRFSVFRSLPHDVPPGGHALIPIAVPPGSRGPSASVEIALGRKNGEPLSGQGVEFLRIP